MFRAVSVIVAITLLACAGGPELPKAGPGQGDASRGQALVEQADALFKAMLRPEDIPPTIAAYEEVLKVAPEHKHALVQLSYLLDHRGLWVDPVDDKDQQMASFLRGREMGLRALAQNPRFREAYAKDQDMVKHVGLFTKDDAPALYWAALSWAHWGERYGLIRSAIDIPKVKAMMDRVNELDRGYFGNAADRFFIGYWVAIPGFAGKDPKKSQAAFERASKEAPLFLSNDVVLAQYYAKDVEDPALFESALRKVIDAPPDPAEFPHKLDNNLARSDAKLWLGKKAEIFD